MCLSFFKKLFRKLCCCFYKNENTLTYDNQNYNQSQYHYYSGCDFGRNDL